MILMVYGVFIRVYEFVVTIDRLTLLAAIIGVILTGWIVREMVRQKKKADVVIDAQILSWNEERISGMKHYLNIENRGPANATGIEVFYNGKSFQEQWENRCPPTELKAGERWAGGEIPKRATIEVKWKDGLKKEHSRQSTFI